MAGAVDAETVKKIEGAYDILQKDEKGHSLLKKYLSKDVIEHLKNKKTAMGASLWDCIQSGKCTATTNFEWRISYQ